MIIGVSELQKKISIFKNLTENVHIIDKKSKQLLATVFPQKKMEKENMTESLAGCLASYKPDKHYDTMEDMITEAYEREMEDKYGK